MRALFAALLIATFLQASDARAKPIDLAAERAAIREFQAADQRLQDVGWKLVRGNAASCDRGTASVGLQLQDLASYGNPNVARDALELTGDFAVQTAARGSPAARSGAFTPNREIVALGNADPNAWNAGQKRDWRRLANAHDHIDRLLRENGEIAIGFADGSRATLRPVPVCATRFELASNSKRAVADGDRVVVGTRFPAFAYEEPRFAALVAHELAHNLLGHSAWLDREGRAQRRVRRTEREADRLMPWLLANAGYDPRAAIDFMATWGRRHDGGIFRKRTHDGWDERAEFIAAEIPRIEALIASEGSADWSVHFERGIDPDGEQER